MRGRFRTVRMVWVTSSPAVPLPLVAGHDHPAFPVDYPDGDAVYLQFEVHGEVWVSQLVCHPFVPSQKILLVEGVGEAEHGRGVLHLFEGAGGLARYPLGWRVRVLDLRVVVFQERESLHQEVVVGVGYDRVVVLVVEHVVAADIGSQVLGLFRGQFAGLGWIGFQKVGVRTSAGVRQVAVEDGVEERFQCLGYVEGSGAALDGLCGALYEEVRFLGCWVQAGEDGEYCGLVLGGGHLRLPMVWIVALLGVWEGVSRVPVILVVCGRISGSSLPALGFPVAFGVGGRLVVLLLLVDWGGESPGSRAFLVGWIPCSCAGCPCLDIRPLFLFVAPECFLTLVLDFGQLGCSFQGFPGICSLVEVFGAWMFVVCGPEPEDTTPGT